MKREASSSKTAGSVGMSMDHVSLTVRSVDRSVEFYEAIGLRLLRVTRMRRSSGEEYRNAYMYTGHFMMELLPLLGRNPRPPRRPRTIEAALHGLSGLTHLGFRVRSLDAAIGRLREIGAPMIGEPFSISRESVDVAYFDQRASRAVRYVRKPAKKPWRIALFSDPDGVSVELVER